MVVEQLEDEYNPYAAFDIGNCDTYSHLWTYDLFASCATGEASCQCIYTAELMAMELLTCSEIDKCPEEASIQPPIKIEPQAISTATSSSGNLETTSQISNLTQQICFLTDQFFLLSFPLPQFVPLFCINSLEFLRCLA